MKRSLGLHCTILQINTSKTDTDSTLVPSEWLSASEELHDLDHPPRQIAISDSDNLNLEKFTRELITQSVVPHMERCISLWNDQVTPRPTPANQIASYRRGLAGRVFTASRRLFGSSSRSATPTTGTGNYDLQSASYPPSTPESQMRKLADYAFMLRDYKLAQSTYDIVRKDFANDKAWNYVAGAQVRLRAGWLILGNDYYIAFDVVLVAYDCEANGDG
jgi:trafficking protein particle complex subunit 8